MNGTQAHMSNSNISHEFHLHVCMPWFSMQIVVFINLAIFNSNNVFNLDKRALLSQLVGWLLRLLPSMQHHPFLFSLFSPMQCGMCVFSLLCVTEYNINVPNFYVQGGQWHFSHFICALNDRSDAIGSMVTYYGNKIFSIVILLEHRNNYSIRYGMHEPMKNSSSYFHPNFNTCY